MANIDQKQNQKLKKKHITQRNSRSYKRRIIDPPNFKCTYTAPGVGSGYLFFGFTRNTRILRYGYGYKKSCFLKFKNLNNTQGESDFLTLQLDSIFLIFKKIWFHSWLNCFYCLLVYVYCFCLRNEVFWTKNLAHLRKFGLDWRLWRPMSTEWLIDYWYHCFFGPNFLSVPNISFLAQICYFFPNILRAPNLLFSDQNY